MAKNKPSFYGVEEIHTIMVPDDDDIVYVGMKVQGTSKGKRDIILILHPEQIIDIYDYLLKRTLEKNENNERNGII